MEILRAGFRDPSHAQRFWTGRSYIGVWLFLGPYPTDTLSASRTEVLLDVEIRAELADLEAWFVIDWEHALWREWCIPAAWVNDHGAVKRAATPRC